MACKRYEQGLRKSRNSVSRPERWWRGGCDQHSSPETRYSYKKGLFKEGKKWKLNSRIRSGNNLGGRKHLPWCLSLAKPNQKPEDKIT